MLASFSSRKRRVTLLLVTRHVLLLIAATVVLVGALDLASRWVLGRDLVALARSRAAIAAPPAPAVVAAEGPLVTTLENPRYTILAVAPAGCARGPACDITLTIEPAPGLSLVPYGPYAFLPTPSDAFTYDAPAGKIRAKERTASRAVVAVPARLAAGAAPASLEGRLRVITCNAETCKSEIADISIALPSRPPSG